MRSGADRLIMVSLASACNLPLDGGLDLGLRQVGSWLCHQLRKEGPEDSCWQEMATHLKTSFSWSAMASGRDCMPRLKDTTVWPLGFAGSATSCSASWGICRASFLAFLRAARTPPRMLPPCCSSACTCRAAAWQQLQGSYSRQFISCQGRTCAS